MSYTSSYSSSTTSGTSSSVGTTTTAGDTTSTSSTTATITTEVSSPDDSDGLAGSLGGGAVAIGEDTLATGSITGELADSGSITSLSGSTTMVAASESPEGETAYTSADTFGIVSDGADVVFSFTLDQDSSEESPTGSSSTSTSTTTIAAYDIHPDEPLVATGSGSDGSTGEDDEPSSGEVDDGSGGDGGSGGGDGLDGNLAEIEFDASVFGQDTLVAADAYALVIEDELSLVDGYIDFAVD